jgi:hypothetical protein
MNSCKYCEYIKSACTELEDSDSKLKGFFIYPSLPTHLSQTVATAVRELKKHSSDSQWKSWEDLSTAGQIIFCQVCKAINDSDFIVANITTLNFNIMFEIGYAIGLNKPVIPVRDTTYIKDEDFFNELGIFDVLGYEDFQNSQQLRKIVTKNKNLSPLKLANYTIDKQHPTYLVKSPHNSDGSVRLLSELKKSALFRFRSYDPQENPRLSLHEAIKQVKNSVAIIAHLIDSERRGSQTHNALCAFVCGIAMSMGKHILMLQEGHTTQPIDYRDVVIPYKDADEIPKILPLFVRKASETLYYSRESNGISPSGLLEKVDLGDVAAENEIRTLHRYFVKTPQYQQTRKGHARLVVGRKGSGKTAIFYEVRNDIYNNSNSIVLSLKPEGHHFTKLREMVIDHLSEGLQLHTLTSFWSYLILLEIAYQIISNLKNNAKAWQTHESLKSYEELKDEYKKHEYNSDGDFSERILGLVDKIIAAYPKELKGKLKTPDITRMIYQSDIKNLNNLIIKNIKKKEELWLLFDNIDKGWSIKGATPADIAIVRSLLEASRKLQRQLDSNGINFKSIIFLRKDICDLLIEHTPDRGKESIANLDWSDEILFEELLRRRIASISELKDMSFREIWQNLFDAHVGGTDSFRYMLDRSFLHPRSLLNFVTKCIQTAISRDHKRVLEEDILFAEEGFSEDSFNNLKYEIRDVFPKYPKLIQLFIGKDKYLSHDDIELILLESGMEEKEIDDILDILLWFSFLGVNYLCDTKYAYHFSYNIEKLKAYIPDSDPSKKVFAIHPSFYHALDIINI